MNKKNVKTGRSSLVIKRTQTAEITSETGISEMINPVRAIFGKSLFKPNNPVINVINQIVKEINAGRGENIEIISNKPNANEITAQLFIFSLIN